MRIIIDVSKEHSAEVITEGVTFSVGLENIPQDRQWEITDLEISRDNLREELRVYKINHPSVYNKISAIKALREKTQLGLIEAKDIIDAAFNAGAPVNSW